MTDSEFFNLYIYNGALLEIRAIFGKKKKKTQTISYCTINKSFPSFVLQFLQLQILYIHRIDQ